MHSYIGLFKDNISLIPLGLKSKLSLINFSTCFDFSSSPSNRSTYIDKGLETPIA